jgi:hypothetical protein
MLKAIPSRRGDETVDLARATLRRQARARRSRRASRRAGNRAKIMTFARESSATTERRRRRD